MKTLYESIFDDDNDIIKDTEDSIKKQIMEYLNIPSYLKDFVKIQIGNPIDVNVWHSAACDDIKNNIFNTPPMDIKYSYLYRLRISNNTNPVYIPNIEHCKILEIKNYNSVINKLKIDKLDSIEISDRMGKNEMISIIDLGLKSNISQLDINVFRGGPMFDLTDIIPKMAHIKRTMISYDNLAGMKYDRRKVYIQELYNDYVENLVSAFNKYLDTPSHGELIIWASDKGKTLYFEVQKSNRKGVGYGIKFKKVDIQ